MNKTAKKVILLFCVTIAIIGSVGIYNNYFQPAEPAVEIVSEKVLVPGGHSVGIKMDVKGVLVVGLEEIETEDKIINPGLESGLQVGDIILSINGKDVYYAYEVTEIVKKSNGKLNMRVLRGEEEHEYSVNAAKDFETGEYMLGIWVKEKIAGIGTLSFYDPETNSFAALGHGIYERKTNVLVEAGGGQLLKTQVSSIKEGTAGEPGEIRGIFYDQETPLGNVVKNSKYGIYATGLNTEILEMAEPMAIATQEQIEEGEAYILTTIEGSKVEKFKIEITNVNKQTGINDKGLEIKVTDKKLLSHSGGIVQGMSGSPIIQNNRIVGVVTHVLVNDPTKGYGIFIENMIS